MKKRTSAVQSLKMLSFALAAMVAFVGCSNPGKESPTVKSFSRDEKASLKIAYANEESFFMQYGNTYNALFPNVDVEVISTQSVWNADDPAAELVKLVEEQQPDVVALTEDQYELLAAQGSLYDLDAVIKQDQFDIDKMMPGAVDILKTKGGGKLYGLAPTFSSKALYYNKDIFDQHNVPYPTDKMSWEEVLQLAERFPSEGEGNQKTYGLVVSGDTAFDLVETMGTAKGLTYVDYDSGELAINTDEWSSVFETVINSYKSGKVYIPGSSDSPNVGFGGGGNGGGAGGARTMVRSIGGNAIQIGGNTLNFASGRAAMTIDQAFLMNMLEMTQRFGGGQQRKGAVSAGDGGGMLEIKEINWDLVTIPVDPTNPDVTGNLGLDMIWSIHASSQNIGPAWELLKYINGDQLAKTNAKSAINLSTRTEYISSDEHNLEAFSELALNPVVYAQKFPAGFKEEFASMASEEIEAAINGTKAVAEVLNELQTKGQDLLTQKKLDEQ